MADREMVLALAECLDALRKGEAALERCLVQYPAYRADLEALLNTARLIPALPPEVEPSLRFRTMTRRRLFTPPNDSGPSLHGGQPQRLLP